MKTKIWNTQADISGRWKGRIHQTRNSSMKRSCIDTPSSESFTILDTTHCRASSLYDHLDHCFVVFESLQQSFLTRRMHVWGNKNQHCLHHQSFHEFSCTGLTVLAFPHIHVTRSRNGDPSRTGLTILVYPHFRLTRLKMWWVVSHKDSTRNSVGRIILSKVQNLTLCFQLFAWFEFDPSARRN